MSNELILKDHPGEKLSLVFSKEQIARRVRELAREIEAEYRNEPLIAVCVLKGAFIFFSDLVRAISSPDMVLDFTRITSYGLNSASSGEVKIIKDIDADIGGKHVLIVEDIIDSGHTMHFLKGLYEARQPLSCRIAALIDKAERREANINVDYVGFTAEGFLVGYGMDYAEHYRGLPDIYNVVDL